MLTLLTQMKHKFLILLLGVLVVLGSILYFNSYSNEFIVDETNCQEDINSLVFLKQFAYDDMSVEEKNSFNLNAYSVIKRCDNILD